jgi:alkylation response protein AidB-like acyl-CoA dehydrogenase
VTHEAADFAAAVALAADRSLEEPDAWVPGTAQDDGSPGLTRALAAMGWLELAADAELAPLAGPAGVELGRRLAPLGDLDVLLGGSPLAGGLARYGAPLVVEPATDGGLRLHAIVRSEPVAYADSQGVVRVLERRLAGRLAPAITEVRITAWTAASVGYLAGLSDWAIGLTGEHVRSRRAFGSTLAALAPVQQRLAEAATTARGLVLLAGAEPGPAALAHAGAAAVAVTAACQQLVGAVGFTLEFPLQRAFRRARAAQVWADAFLARALR